MSDAIYEILIGSYNGKQTKEQQVRKRALELVNAVLDGDKVRYRADIHYIHETFIDDAVRDIKKAIDNLKGDIDCYILKSEEQQANIDLAKQKRKEAAKLIAEAEELENG